MDSNKISRFTHLISDERWGETCLIENVDQFVNDMEESMFPASVQVQKLSELQEIAAERGEECEETLETIAQGWRDGLLDVLQGVEAVFLPDGRDCWMVADGSIYAETANGLAGFVGEWSYMRNTELSAVVKAVMGDSIVHNDRGNGCGGAGYEDATDVYNEIQREEREDEDLTSVTKGEDAQAWELAKEAFQALKLDPSSIRAVYVGERADGDNGHQIIYVV